MIRSNTCERVRRLAGAACLAGGLLTPAVARADGDPVAAQALFKAARERIQAGDYAEGCPKFEASFALQASASTLLNIAKCHEHEGKIATAWDDYQRALTLNRETRGEQRKQELERIAKKGIAALEPRLPRLRVVIREPSSELSVMRDGKALPAAALGEPLPADPGPHEIRASAPGRRPATRSVTLEEGKVATVEITLEPLPAEGPAPPPKDKPGAASRVPVWAWVTGAAGVALAGAAVYFLVDDLAAISALRANCRDVPGGTYCPVTYDHARDNARKNRDFGLTVGLGGAGVIGLGAATFGIVQAVTKKRPATTARPWIAPGSGGAMFSGRF